MTVWLGCWLPLALQAAAPAAPLFMLGQPDGSSLEFGLVDKRYPHYLAVYPRPVEFVVGRSSLADWPYIHPSNHDKWAGGTNHTFTIRFPLAKVPAQTQHLILGLADSHTPSKVTITLNGKEIGSQRSPKGYCLASDPEREGLVSTMIFPVSATHLVAGENRLAINLEGGSWIIYDYVTLGASKAPPAAAPVEELRDQFLAGPLKEVQDIVFATRKVGNDGHWYANIGYYSDCEQELEVNQRIHTHNGKRVAYRLGGKLGKLNVRTREVAWLINDPDGGVRDPVLHYDGETILFSYRQGNGEHYHLYTIQKDGSRLTQLTSGDYDDIEPCWLPDGGIVFVSTRAKRWVNCWITQVATLHRCDADGQNLRAISANNEQDNTPWVLPDGRLLYQRWEYVDRSQVDYHHLWTANPDGTSQMVYFGNQRPGIVMIDAKPVPNSTKVVAIFSPGHGRAEHAGVLTLVDPSGGPDNPGLSKPLVRGDDYRDPYPFSENAFLAAFGPELRLVNGRGQQTTLYRLPEEEVKAGFLLHEPRPVMARERERVVAPTVKLRETTGRVVMANVYEGRNMAGIKPGDIKKLLVLETLPKPVNFTGGMDPLTYGGSFTLERVLGTVPVEADGSAYMELPAGRGLFVVALDEKDLSVKRMQSFMTVQPGEVASCVGCHEQRTQSYIPNRPLLATRRAPSVIEPIRDCPEVFDFPRDIQPILNRLCVECHDATPGPRGGPYAGKVLLTGDHGPMFSHAYFTMTVKRLFSDGRNQPVSNYAPRQLGSSASRIWSFVDGSHYGAKATEHDRKMLRLWIEVGAPYPGTYAALGAGSIGGYQENTPVHVDNQWPTTQAGAAAMDRRCASCHQQNKGLPHAFADELGLSFWRFAMDDPRLQFSRHILFNLTRPDKSLLLLAPLAPAAGGLGICKTPEGKPVLADTQDADYRALLAMASAGRDYLAKIKRFDMPDYRPREGWYREMKRYGILPKDLDPRARIDYYATEERYWQSMWAKPVP